MKTLHLLIISSVLVFLTVSYSMALADVVYNTGPPIMVKVFGSPLKQIRSGVAEDKISCDLPSVLVLKSKDGIPTCIKPKHLGFLLARGWASQNHLPTTFACSENCATDLLYDYGYICRGLAGQNSCFLKNSKYFENESSLKISNTGLAPENPFAANKYGKIDLSKIHLPSNQYGQVDYNKIGYLVSENQFKKILDEMNILYNQDSLLFQEGMSYLTLPPFTDYCGYVKDNNTQEHWFSSSFHNDTLTNYTVYSNNPSPCKPGPPFECFCSLETRIAENNLKELSYFTASEENAVGNTLSKYFASGNVVNVSNDFFVGKYNLDIDQSLIHYCGKFTWGAQLQYFEGYMKNSSVVDFSLAPEKQKLCAIHSDAKLFSFDESANGIGK